LDHPQFVWWGGSRLALSKFEPALPYMVRFKAFNRLTWLSAWSLLYGCSMAFLTASMLQ
jgi:hypothetical protein